MMKPEIEEMKNDDVPKSVDFLTVRPYVAPSWASHLSHIPAQVCSLGRFPTPIHKWNLPNLPNNTEVWLKEIRVLHRRCFGTGADCVITIGGIQSNHCCTLLLCQALVNQDPGFTGNLLVERLVGANIELVSREEYEEIGSEAMTDYLKSKLVGEGRKPYVIPVGGSNSLGIWGYVEAIREIEQQLHGKMKFDDIVVACGSGGTLDGLSLGLWLSTLNAKIHAFSIYYEDPENYFYGFVKRSLDEFHVNVDSHDIVEVYNARGLGYPMNTSEELNFVREVAESTGVILDPLYSGKAAYGMMKDMTENPKKWEGRKILFIHTGGLLGMYAKVDEMGSVMLEKWRRMDINGPTSD